MHLPVRNIQVARAVGCHASPRSRSWSFQLALHDSGQLESFIANPNFHRPKLNPHGAGGEWTCLISSMKDPLPCIGPWRCVSHDGRNMHRGDQLLLFQQQHGLNTPRSSTRLYITTTLQPRNWRCQSSQSKAKANLKDANRAQIAVSRPDIRIMGQATNTVHSTKGSETTELGNASETLKKTKAWETLENFDAGRPSDRAKIEEETRHQQLKADYYNSVAKNSEVLWLPLDELKGVPESLASRWLFKPVGSRDRRCGLKQQNVIATYVAVYISNPNIRKKIIL
jgi:hypothetical protein